MRKVKNLIILLIIFIMLTATMLMNNVYAAGTYNVELIANNKYKPGDEFEISINVKNISNIGGSAGGLCALVADVSYDEDKLEVVSSDGKNGFDLTWGERLVLDDKAGVNTDTELAVIKFKIKDDAEEGNTAIALLNIVSSNGEENISTSDSVKNITIAKEVPVDIKIDSDIYIIETEEGINYFTNLIENETVKDVKDNITINSDTAYVKFYNYNGRELEEDDNVGTGVLIELYNGSGELVKEYYTVQKGDLDGDGKITATDLAKIRRHLAEIEFLKDEFYRAAKIIGEDKITVTDLAKIRRHLADLEHLY